MNACSALRLLLLSAIAAAAQPITLVSSTANAVNNMGLIVGSRCFSDSTCHATLWYGNMFSIDLGTLPGGTSSVATGINNMNQIVGYATVADGPIVASYPPAFAAPLPPTATHAVLWNFGQMVDLGVLRPGDTFSHAAAINDSGQIAGSSCSPQPAATMPDFPDCHAIFHDGQMHDLGVIPGGSTSWAISINKNGDVAGYGDAPPGIGYPPDYRHTIHGIAWSQSAISQNFGGTESSTFFSGINDTGAVSGSNRLAAFILENGATGDGFPDHTAGHGINNHDQVVGEYFMSGSGRMVGFIWQSGAVSFLRGPASDTDAVGLGICDQGTAVGWVRIANKQVAAMWENGVLTLLDGAGS